jgi:hypothetical protein
LKSERSLTYIDEGYRTKFVKTAKERVCWISPHFSAKEVDAIRSIMKTLGEDKVRVHKSQSKNINDKGYCFSIDESSSHIGVKLLPKNSEELNESLLIVDNTACVYNHKPIEGNINARFLQGIDRVEFTELLNSLEKEKIIQTSLLDNIRKLKEASSMELAKELTAELDKGRKLPARSDGNSKLDIALEELQRKIRKVHIVAPGTRTDKINFEVNDILNIVGRLSSEFDQRLALRWKVFGEDDSIEAEYEKYRRELEVLKDKFTINLGGFGRYILVSNQAEFDSHLHKYRARLKSESTSLLEKKIEESKAILEGLIKQFYFYAAEDRETLKTCSSFEMQNIIEVVRSKFPNARDIRVRSDVLVSYTELSRRDIANREFVKQLLPQLDTRDADLYGKLLNIIND